MRRRSLIVALAWLALGAPPALGQQDEVFVDPDSPTGTEYDIPLERARRDAVPGLDAAERGSGRKAPALFGAGIGDPPATSGGQSAADGPSGSGDGRPGDRPSSSNAGPEAGVPPAVQAAIQRPGAPEGGFGPALAVAGVGFTVLAGGAATGLALRRRRS